MTANPKKSAKASANKLSLPELSGTQRENLSNSGQRHESGIVDLQVNALANVLAVARGRASADQIAELTTIEAQLDCARRQFEEMRALPELHQEQATDALRAAVLDYIKAWKPRRSARSDIFAELILRGVPIEARPWWHQVRQANYSFYHALPKTCAASGLDLAALFPRAQGAEGGALKGRGPRTSDEIADMRRKRREAQRDFMRRKRARHASP